MTFEKDDKVRVVKYHLDRLVNRKGRVVAVRDGWPRHVKVRIRGTANRHLNGEPFWFFREDELEAI